jgi:hypothetical protein
MTVADDKPRVRVPDRVSFVASSVVRLGLLPNQRLDNASCHGQTLSNGPNHGTHEGPKHGSARTALFASTAMPAIQFRGIGRAARPSDDGAAGKKPEAGDDDMKDGEKKDIAGKAADDDEQPDDDKDPDPDRKPARKKAKAKRVKADDSTDGDEDEDHDPDDDDDDDDDKSDRRAARGNTPVRAARLRERGRIAAILESPSAAANLEFAVRLALTTDLPRQEAISLLNAAPKSGGKLADRMDGYRNLRPGTGEAAAPKGQAAIDALWDTQAVANGITRRRA